MIDDVLIVSTIALPLTVAVAAAAAGRRFVSVLGALAWAGACAALAYRVFAFGIQTVQVGGWQAPYGITLVADRLSALVLVTGAVIGVVAAGCRADSEGAERRLYGPLVHVLLAAFSGAVVAGDLFNLFVWFELLLIASFVLLVIGRGRTRLQGALKYAVISVVGSVFFLGGIGLTYGITGTLNLADLALRIGEADTPTTAVSMVFLVAFGLKSAAFPLYFWLPASYPAAAPPVGALFAGLLTKVGVYGLLRLFTLVFTQNVAFTHTAVLWVAGFTMVIGLLGAVVQQSFRRVAAFVVVATIGFILVGLGLFSRMSLTGAIYYMLEDAIVVATLFFFAGVLQSRYGTDRIDQIDGLRGPIVKLLFFVPTLSLAGIPPLAGFWSKLMLTRSALESSAYVVTAVMLCCSLALFAAMLRVWFGPFGRRDEVSRVVEKTFGAEQFLVPVAALVSVTILISLFAGWVVELASLAAADLIDTTGYVDAVLGD